MPIRWTPAGPAKFFLPELKFYSPPQRVPPVEALDYFFLNFVATLGLIPIGSSLVSVPKRKVLSWMNQKDPFLEEASTSTKPSPFGPTWLRTYVATSVLSCISVLYPFLTDLSPPLEEFTSKLLRLICGWVLSALFFVINKYLCLYFQEINGWGAEVTVKQTLLLSTS